MSNSVTAGGTNSAAGRDTMGRARRVISAAVLIVVIVAAVVFVVQNLASIRLHFLGWDFGVDAGLALLVAVAAGVAIGLLSAAGVRVMRAVK